MEAQNTKNIGRLFEKAEQLHIAVAGLTVKVDEGFRGIHRRQDITNGRIEKSEGQIIDLQQTDETLVAEVQDLTEARAADIVRREGKSARLQNLAYSILEKVVWIGLGIILYNGRKVFDLFFS